MLASSASSRAGLFDNPSFHLQYCVSAIPQILLLLYLMEKTDGYANYGVGAMGFSEAKAAVASAFMLTVFGLTLSLAAKSLKMPVESTGSAFTNPRMIPLVLITCLVTGYREELFFRSFMIRKMEEENAPLWAIYGGTSVLFGLGHAYQGIWGILATTFIGLFLAAVFRKKRNLHVNALSHAAYNFSILLLSLFLAN